MPHMAKMAMLHTGKMPVLQLAAGLSQPVQGL